MYVFLFCCFVLHYSLWLEASDIISIVSGLKYLYFQKFGLKQKRLRGIIIISIYCLVALVP